MGRDRHDGAAASAAPASADGVAPGKRALTDRMVRRARRKNPIMQAKLGFAPAAYSAAPVDSDQFAHDVAAKQGDRGVRVDGVVGPRTHQAVTGQDPFAYLHEPGRARGKAGSEAAHRGGAGAAPTARPVQSVIVDRRASGEGMQLACAAGAADGITADSRFTLCYPSGIPFDQGALVLVEVRQAVTVLRSDIWHIDTLPGDVDVLAYVPQHAAPAIHADGSIGDDDGAGLEA